MTEQFLIGQLTCDFMGPNEFFDVCRTWLTTNNFHHVVTLNPEMVMQAESDNAFAKAVNSADIRVPDGAGLIWARWFMRSQFWSLIPSLLAFPFIEVERVTGVDALLELAKMCADNQRSVYLLGGTPSQATKTAKILLKRFPNITVFTSPDHAFDISGPKKILDDIMAKKPAVLFVAYGAPKQTIWIEAHRSQLAQVVKIAVGVGGAFAILSEERPRAPWIFRRLNTEWLWRLILEPSRLPRIWQATVKFPMLVNSEKSKPI